MKMSIWETSPNGHWETSPDGHFQMGTCKKWQNIIKYTQIGG